jgi:hypothetical protein
MSWLLALNDERTDGRADGRTDGRAPSCSLVPGRPKAAAGRMVQPVGGAEDASDGSGDGEGGSGKLTAAAGHTSKGSSSVVRDISYSVWCLTAWTDGRTDGQTILCPLICARTRAVTAAETSAAASARLRLLLQFE